MNKKILEKIAAGYNESRGYEISEKQHNGPTNAFTQDFLQTIKAGYKEPYLRELIYPQKFTTTPEDREKYKAILIDIALS